MTCGYDDFLERHVWNRDVDQDFRCEYTVNLIMGGVDETKE